MCGRYVTRTEAALERHWNLVRPWPQSIVSYNVTPSQQVPVVVLRDPGRCGELMRWGLVPFWAKGEPQKYSTINARAETLETAATYRGPWSRAQRCILPATGFYEWKESPSGKQPYFLRLAGGEPFGFAGLWERSFKPDGSAVESCTVITVPANALLAEIHAKGRMPAILTPDCATAWLEASPGEARALLTPYPAAQMDAWPVSRRVNSPRNDDPQLIEHAEAC